MKNVLLFLFVAFSLFSDTAKVSILTFHYKDDPTYLSNIWNLLDKQKNENKNSIIINTGDILSPHWLSGFDKGKHVIDILNEMKIDYLCIGNHDFDFGASILKKRMEESKFTWLSTNILSEDNSFIKNNAIIIEKDKIKIGLFGLITEDAANISNTKGTYFLPYLDIAKDTCDSLKKAGVDVIIAVTHLNAYQTNKLAEEVSNIDIILSDHSNEKFSFYKNDVYIFSFDEKLNALGRIDLIIERNDYSNSNVSIYPVGTVIKNDNKEVNNEKLKILKNFFLEEEQWQLIGLVKEKIDNTKNVKNINESIVGNSIADIMKMHFNTDAAIINNGCMRSDRVYEQNSVISKIDVYKELPFGNDTVVLKMTGQGLVNAFQEMVKNKESFQVAGINLSIDKNNNINKVLINGEEVKEESTYKITIIDYLFDCYDSFSQSEILISKDKQVKLTDLVIDFIRDKKILSPINEKRIERLN